MLTGRVPFDAETTTTIYYKQVHERPPSVLAPCPGLPPGVEQVVNRALAKSPAERYGSRGELIRALEQTVARPIPPSRLVSPPAQRPVAPPPSPARHLVPLAVIVGVGEALLLCGSLVAYLIVRSSKLSVGAPTPALVRPVAAAPTSAEASNALSPPAQPVARPTGTPLLAATVTALVPAPAPTITQSPMPRASLQIVFSSARGGNADLYITNMDGSGVTQLTTSPGQDEYPAVSPDGRRISFMSDRDGNIEIYVINRDGTGETRLTVDSGEDRLPNWSPNGRQIIFISNCSGNFQLYVMDADGQNVRRLTHNTRRDGHASWSANDWIVFNSGDADDSATWEIYVIRADGSGERRLTTNNVNDWSPNWSPDGRQILYLSKRDGKDDAAIWVMNADGSNPQLVYNNPGAYEWGAVWSPDGGYIAFNSDVDGKDNIFLLRLSDQKVTQLTTEGGTYPGWAP